MNFLKNPEFLKEIAAAAGADRKVAPMPGRVFGPVSPADAEMLADLILDDRDCLRDTLIRYLRGDLHPGGVSYEVDVLAEAESERAHRALKEQAREDMYSDEHEGGGFGA